jgi:hypothetical protein
MSPATLEAALAEIAALAARAESAERRACLAEAERDRLRALLGRLRTSLVETLNDPGEAM